MSETGAPTPEVTAPDALATGVTNRQIGELAIGILALYLLTQALLSASWLASAAVGQPASLSVTAFPALVHFAVAGAIWSWRARLAERLFPIPEPTTLPVRAGTIAIGIIGLLTIVGVATTLGGILAFLTTAAHYVGWLRATWIGLVPLAAAALVAAFFIFRSERIVARLISTPTEEQSGDAAPIAFAAVGLYMAATAFPRIVSIWAGSHVRGPGMRYDWWPAAAHIGQNAFILLLGLGLFFGRARLARAWRSLRSMNDSQ